MGSTDKKKGAVKGHQRNNTIAGGAATMVFPTDSAIDAFQS